MLGEVEEGVKHFAHSEWFDFENDRSEGWPYLFHWYIHCHLILEVGYQNVCEGR